MDIESIDLACATPGTRHSVQVLRFGERGAAPKVYIQGALHADEVPAILVAQALRTRLQALEAAGRLRGEVVLVPSANPLGLSQIVLGQQLGRFDLQDGGNFNRGFPDLSTPVIDAVRSQLTGDLQHNTHIVRRALRTAAAALVPRNSTEELKHRLLQLAVDADIVLDMHCDSDAVLHLYALTPHSPMAQQLGAALSARAVLLATESGGSPFDEACTRPWYTLQRQMPTVPVALACFAATIELRGEADTSHAMAGQDAEGLLHFLHLQGVLTGAAPTLPDALCQPTPLAASEPITAPHAGVLVFHRKPGDQVQAGDAIADLVHPASGAITTLHCESAGLVYARCASRWAHAGKRLAKIAGNTLQRSGALLSP